MAQGLAEAGSSVSLVAGGAWPFLVGGVIYLAVDEKLVDPMLAQLTLVEPGIAAERSWQGITVWRRLTWRWRRGCLSGGGRDGDVTSDTASFNGRVGVVVGSRSGVVPAKRLPTFLWTCVPIRGPSRLRPLANFWEPKRAPTPSGEASRSGDGLSRTDELACAVGLSC